VSDSIQKSLAESESSLFPAVSLRLSRKEIPLLFPQEYLFYVERWTVQGVKDIEKMVYYARASTENSDFLSEEEPNSWSPPRQGLV
jgi:hypothetical protein